MILKAFQKGALGAGLKHFHKHACNNGITRHGMLFKGDTGMDNSNLALTIQ
jgi:hypothetical protein